MTEVRKLSASWTEFFLKFHTKVFLLPVQLCYSHLLISVCVVEEENAGVEMCRLLLFLLQKGQERDGKVRTVPSREMAVLHC